MGGCSSKPKTAEFEGSMDLQEGKPHVEAARQSSDAGVNTGLNCIDREQESAMQTLLNEKDALRKVLAETEKHLVAGFNSEDNLIEEQHKIEGDPKHVKQVLEEISDDLGVEKKLSVTGETLKLPKDPEVLASEKSELFRDSVLIKEGTKELQDTPLLSVIEAETVNLQKEPLSPTEKSIKIEDKNVSPEFETLAEQKENVASVKDASELQTGPQDETLEQSIDLVVGGEQVLELQKESSVPKDRNLGLQKDASGEASERGEKTLDDDTGHKGHDRQIEEADNKFTVKVVTDANECDLTAEREEKISEVASKLMLEEQNVKDVATEEAAEEIITSSSVDKQPTAKSLHITAAQRLEIKEIDSTRVVTPFTTADVSPDDMQPTVGKQSYVLVGHEEQMQVNKNVDDAAGTSAEIFAKSQAADHFLSKESSGEMLGTTLMEGDYIWGKTNVDSKYISSLGMVLEEPIHMELPEMTVDEVQGEKLNITCTCNGQLKSDVASIPDQATAPQVSATAEKPDAQFVHVKEPTERTFRKDTLAQEISAPDIDEVWEKLASEFERQESLARSIP